MHTSTHRLIYSSTHAHLLIDVFIYLPSRIACFFLPFLFSSTSLFDSCFAWLGTLYVDNVHSYLSLSPFLSLSSAVLSSSSIPSILYSPSSLLSISAWRLVLSLSLLSCPSYEHLIMIISWDFSYSISLSHYLTLPFYHSTTLASPSRFPDPIIASQHT